MTEKLGEGMRDSEAAGRSVMPKIVDKTDFSRFGGCDDTEEVRGFSQDDHGQEGVLPPADEGLREAARHEQSGNFQHPDAFAFRGGQAVGPSESFDGGARNNFPWNPQSVSSFKTSPRDMESISTTFDKISGIQDSAALRTKNVFLHWLKEISVVVVISLLLSLVIKTFFFRAFYIPSGSMENTLRINDRIFVSLLTPRYFDLKRGDVVVFEDTDHWLPPTAVDRNSDNWLQQGLVFLGLMPDNSQQHLIKRIIGMPGDKVTCCSAKGKVEVNGVALTEPYLYPGSAKMDLNFEVVVPKDHVWVMGDHRNASADSRFHMQDPGKGFVPIKNVLGKANAIAWPISRWDVIDSHPEVFEGVPEAAP